jgi:hypothetical protein
MMVQRTDDHALPPTFWFKPIGTFGLSDVTAPKDVHICWSYPLIPCSSPPSCWQIPPCLAAWRTGYPAVTLSPELHTEPLPAPHVRVGTADGTAGFISGIATSVKQKFMRPQVARSRRQGAPLLTRFVIPRRKTVPLLDKSGHIKISSTASAERRWARAGGCVHPPRPLPALRAGDRHTNIPWHSPWC